jgi:hypothetical protein
MATPGVNTRKEVEEKEKVGKVSDSLGLHGLRQVKVGASRDIATSAVSTDTEQLIVDWLRRGSGQEIGVGRLQYQLCLLLLQC